MCKQKICHKTRLVISASPPLRPVITPLHPISWRALVGTRRGPLLTDSRIAGFLGVEVVPNGIFVSLLSGKLGARLE